MIHLENALTTCYQSSKIDTKNGVIDSIFVEGNKVSFTMQDGPVSEFGVNGITVLEAIEYFKQVSKSMESL